MDWKILFWLTLAFSILFLLMLRSANKDINRLTQRRWLIMRSNYVMIGTEDEPIHNTTTNSLICLAPDEMNALKIFREWELPKVPENAELGEIEISEITLK